MWVPTEAVASPRRVARPRRRSWTTRSLYLAARLQTMAQGSIVGILIRDGMVERMVLGIDRRDAVDHSKLDQEPPLPGTPHENGPDRRFGARIRVIAGMIT